MLVVQAVHPAVQSEPVAQGIDQPAVVDIGPVHRMVLDRQVQVGRGLGGEGDHHLLDEVFHAGEARVMADLAVVMHLQRHQEPAL